MLNQNSLRAAVRLALLAAASSAIAVPALAQDKGTSGAVLEEVTVTGSRIAKRDAVSESPIVTVDAEAITNSGFTVVEQYLNTLPQVVPGISSQSNNPSSNGRAFIDLRGLGSGRNLVLIDGRRGMGSTSGGTVDVNTIPSALIERVEVISGGAAATYGADAVAGVVNFIMKKDFEGFAVGGNYGLSEQSDGQEWTTNLTYGGSFAEGRGRAVFNMNYYNRKAIYLGAREFAAQATTTTGIFPGGSWSPGTNTPTQAAVDAVFGANTCNTNGGSTGFGFNPDGSLFCTGVGGNARDVVGYTGPASDIAQNFYPDFFSYNFAPANILVLPMERWSTYANVDLEVNDHFKPYAQAMFTNYNAKQELAPTPAGGTTGFTIPVTNPFIPAQLATLLATRTTPGAAIAFSKRFNTLGGRTGYNDHDVWQFVTGTRGDIAGSWKYDVYASFGRSHQTEIQGGNVRLDRTQQLLNAADGGRSLCAGGLNLFGNAAISDACRTFISLEAKNRTLVEQNMYEATMSGDLFELPAGTVQTVIGASYRDISFDFKPDSGLQPGLVAGFNQQLPTTGKQNFKDFFAEIEVPILKDLPAVQSLSFNGGFRVTNSSVTGSDNTYKATLTWKTNDWAMIRGGYQHAVRSPNISELYAPQLNNFPTATNQDPCNTTGTIAATYRNGPNGAAIRALCAAQSPVAGGTAFVQPAGQFTAITGGNPNLDVEQADSWSVGVSLSSPWQTPALERLSLTLDYTHIKIEDLIASVGAVTIVQRCYNRDGANPSFSPTNEWCALFQRDPNNGGVINLQQLSRNQAFWTVSGIDMSLNYGLPIGSLGDLNAQAIVSWTEKNNQQVTNVDPVFNYTGSIGSTTASSVPRWRGTFVLTHSIADLQTQLTTRYISPMINAQVVTGGSPISNTGTKETWYFDLSARYNVMENFSVRLTVNNLMNQQPRLYSPNVQSNTDPSLFDVLGRRYTLGFEMKL